MLTSTRIPINASSKTCNAGSSFSKGTSRVPLRVCEPAWAAPRLRGHHMHTAQSMFPYMQYNTTGHRVKSAVLDLLAMLRLQVILSGRPVASAMPHCSLHQIFSSCAGFHRQPLIMEGTSLCIHLYEILTARRLLNKARHTSEACLWFEAVGPQLIRQHLCHGCGPECRPRHLEHGFRVQILAAWLQQIKAARSTCSTMHMADDKYRTTNAAIWLHKPCKAMHVLILTAILHTFKPHVLPAKATTKVSRGGCAWQFILCMRPQALTCLKNWPLTAGMHMR